MNTSKLGRKNLGILLLGALAISFALSALSYQVKHSSAQQQQIFTSISVVPSNITLGEENVEIPDQGIPFSINVTVMNVTDLYAWEIRVYYFPSIVNWTSAIYPAGHVFEGKVIVEGITAIKVDITKEFENRTAVNLASPLDPPVEWRWTEVLDPLQSRSEITDWIDVDGTGTLSASDIVLLQVGEQSPLYYRVKQIEFELSKVKLTAELAYVKYGASLMGGESTFSGNGTLCQFTFAAIGPGVSILNFSRPLGGIESKTYLLDSNLDDMSFEASDGAVTVFGIPPGKELSEITLNVDKTTVKLGSNVTISGSIAPTKPLVDVTISYRSPGGTWSLLQMVKTNAQSEYKYVWIPDSAGTFEIKASWEGDDTHERADSPIVTLTVTGDEGGIDFGAYLPYVAVGIAVIVAVVGILYWTRIRKG